MHFTNKSKTNETLLCLAEIEVVDVSKVTGNIYDGKQCDATVEYVFWTGFFP